MEKDLDRSAAEADAALNLTPNYAQAHNSRGIVNIYGGHPLAAVPHIEQAIGLIRRSSTSMSIFSARPTWSPAITRPRLPCSGSASCLVRRPISRAFLAVALGHLGEAEEATQVWRELLEINPKYSFAGHVGRLPFRNQADVDRLAEGLSKAGIAQ